MNPFSSLSPFSAKKQCKEQGRQTILFLPLKAPLHPSFRHEPVPYYRKKGRDRKEAPAGFRPAKAESRGGPADMADSGGWCQRPRGLLEAAPECTGCGTGTSRPPADSLKLCRIALDGGRYRGDPAGMSGQPWGSGACLGRRLPAPSALPPPVDLPPPAILLLLLALAAALPPPVFQFPCG